MKRSLILLLLLSFLGPACSSRTPSTHSTASIAKKYFNKYGKKYKETPFSSSKVNTVEVQEVKELQKDVATSFMVVKLVDGTEIPVIMTLIRKLPLGWRTTSWEWARQESQ